MFIAPCSAVQSRWGVGSEGVLVSASPRVRVRSKSPSVLRAPSTASFRPPGDANSGKKGAENWSLILPRDLGRLCFNTVKSSATNQKGRACFRLSGVVWLVGVVLERVLLCLLAPPFCPALFLSPVLCGDSLVLRLFVVCFWVRDSPSLRALVGSLGLTKAYVFTLVGQSLGSLGARHMRSLDSRNLM